MWQDSKRFGFPCLSGYPGQDASPTTSRPLTPTASHGPGSHLRWRRRPSSLPLPQLLGAVLPPVLVPSPVQFPVRFAWVETFTRTCRF
ncbi:hypothetical protein BDA96_08G010800 [Sorghum bicolor]|uniref:Uncharacterized protein n=1 Tax=Sorghum bicolor TaxID=4558 RepID=A0A921QDC8_SORBI|nr:hypothetical protein BDA96_08G010800 [Sorghum bicolor]